MASFSDIMKKGTGGLKNFIDSVKSEIPTSLSSFQSEVNTYSSDDDGAPPVSDDTFIANGKRGIVVFHVLAVNIAGGAKERVVHVNFRNESIQVFGAGQRNYHCRDLINAKRLARDTVYFETKHSRGLHPKTFKFQGVKYADKFVAYVKTIMDYGDTIWRSFDQLDYNKSGEITAVDLRAAMLSEDVPIDDGEISRIIALSQEGTFTFGDFIDNLINCAVHSLRDCLLELIVKVRSCEDSKGGAAPEPSASSSVAIAVAAADPTLDDFDLLGLEDHDLSPAVTSCKPLDGIESINGGASAVVQDPNAIISFDEQPLGHELSVVPLLPGEIVFIKASTVRWVLCGDEQSGTRSGLGDLLVTNYRIALAPSRKGLAGTGGSRHHRPAFFDEFTFPLQAIHRLTLSPRPQSILQNGFVEIFTKDARVLKLSSLKCNFDTYPALTAIYNSVRQHAMPDKLTKLFCFKYEARFPMDGWIYSDIMVDYARMGIIGDAEWSIMENTCGEISKSYPAHIAVPSEMSREDILASAAHRAESRVPALCYRHRATQTALVRSSQPRTGLGDNVHKCDIALLDAYRRSGTFNQAREHERPAKFYVFDARGKLAVMANKTIGKGTEIAEEYTNTEVLFCNIDNMHVMRNSFERFCGAMYAPSHSNNDSFHTEMAASGWLAHCGKVLDAAVKVAEKMHVERCSVLVHCSDGWDRTPQICGVAQILLDPYYRTLEGFFTVVEKEWCAFGHKIRSRWDHAESAEPNQRSPIFVQFLNIIHNVMVQSEDAFEYNEYLLVFVADHVSSGLFGNFLENTELARKRQLQVTETTQSIWSYVLHRRSQFVNPRYRVYDRPIWPSSDSRHISVWKRYFLRWDASAHPTGVGSEGWRDDWGCGC